MDSDLVLNDLFVAQWCPDQRYFDLLASELRAAGTPEETLANYSHQGKHPTRALTSDQPLSNRARELYKTATGSTLVTWGEAIRWVEEQGRKEENVLYNQLYTFAWVRPNSGVAKPVINHDRFTPKTRPMEAHENLYDLGDLEKLLTRPRMPLYADE